MTFIQESRLGRVVLEENDVLPSDLNINVAPIINKTLNPNL